MSDRTSMGHVAHLLAAHAVGTLEAGEREYVLAHLTDCPTCRAELAAWQAIAQTAREMYFDTSLDDGVSLQQALRRIDAATDGQEASPIPPDPAAMFGIESWVRPTDQPFPRTLAASRGKWAVAQFATVLLVLVTVGVGYFTVGPGRPNADRPVDFPAIEAPSVLSTPDSAGDETTLLQVLLPAEIVPHGEGLGSEIGHATIRPGDRTEWTPGEMASSSGIRAYYVLQGTLSVRADADVRLVRSGSMEAESVAAGTETLLVAGDTWIALSTTEFAAESDSAQPTELLYWVLAVESPGPGDFAAKLSPLPGSWTFDDYEWVPDLTGPPGPATLRLRRVELPVAGRLPAPPGELQFGVTLPVNAAGTPVSRVSSSVGRLPANGTLINVGKKPVTVYVLTLEPTGMGTGTPGP